MFTVFVRGLRLEAEIGVWAHEKGRRQPIVIDIEMDLEPGHPVSHRLADLVRYDLAAEAATRLVAAGHIDTVETLAERIAAHCLADPRVAKVRVRIEKPEAIPAADGVGVALRRQRHPAVKA